jgi:hypothetical protein
LIFLPFPSFPPPHCSFLCPWKNLQSMEQTSIFYHYEPHHPIMEKDKNKSVIIILHSSCSKIYERNKHQISSSCSLFSFFVFITIFLDLHLLLVELYHLHRKIPENQKSKSKNFHSLNKTQNLKKSKHRK